ncbi:MAG: UDP-N-acetylmuramoyl-L-alanyl-D-glutamate--2,6-diaminopimelate ligase [Chitinivibrionales bacterium]|nr:UDP-N-acetylmuramoyl-L-alanyl-D-glutamate--2,6-diaminopimelate ligase [Chitinivibrionales bacterium]
MDARASTNGIILNYLLSELVCDTPFYRKDAFMKWRELLESVSVQASGGEGNPDIRDIVYNSRQAGPGTVFVAIPGTVAHGDRYIPDAVGRGAAAIVSQNPQPHLQAPWVQVARPRNILGELALTLWKLKLYEIKTVGITGTNGKTTCAHLFQQLFETRNGSDRAWLFGTISYHLGKQHKDAHRTTPESSDVFRLLGTTDVRPRSLVMEVSSHALDLNRIAGLTYDCAVFTNLTQDHLDYHKSMHEYYQAKKRLFTDYLRRKGAAIVNIDDTWGRRLATELSKGRIITYGKAHNADVRILNWRCRAHGLDMHLIYEGEIVELTSHLVGAFNVYNIAAFFAGARALGFDAAKVQAVLDSFDQIAGRMERVPLQADFDVIIDYAHTPDALHNVLATAQEFVAGRLFCLFGCGGDRDKAKRPLMAKAVVYNCDEAVITSDNPRGEKPQSIIDEILEGIPLDFAHRVIVDRRNAIAEILSMARPGDCIIIAGKGHETYQEINGQRHHFSDREEVIEAFTDLQSQESYA